MMRASFLTRLGPNDVLVGRGAPSNSNEGNKRFRDLVQSRKREYMSTGKRHMKDRIAREIVDKILNERGGRFVRKIESLVEAEEMGVPDGMTAWTVVSLDTAVQKTKQALRDREFLDETSPSHARAVAAAAAAPFGDETTDAAAAAAATPAAEPSSRYAAADPASAATASPRAMADAVAARRPSLGQQHAASVAVSDYLRTIRSGGAGAGAGSSNVAAASAAMRPQRPISASALDAAAGRLPPHLMNAAGAGGLAGSSRAQLWHQGQNAAHHAATVANPYLYQQSVLFNQGYGGPGAAASLSAGDHLSALLAGRGSGMLPPSIGARGLAGGLPGPGASGMLSSPRFGLQGHHHQQYGASPLASSAMPADNLSNVMDYNAVGPSQRVDRLVGLSQQGDHRLSLGAGSSRSPPGADILSGTKSAAATSSTARGDATNGEAALSIARERLNGTRPCDSRADYLEVTMLELYMLNAMCSHGLPVWSAGGKLQGREGEGSQDTTHFTWLRFANVLGQVAKDLTREERTRASSGVMSDESANRLNKAARSALVEADVLESNPKELARKVVMLLESVWGFARCAKSGVSHARATLKKANYEFWLEEELCRWAATLDCVGDSGRPVPYSTQKFLADLGPQAKMHYLGSELIRPMGMLDQESCQDLFTQIASVTRLRSVAEKCGPGPVLRAKLTKALDDIEKANKIWKQKPKWWGADIDPVNYDEMLLHKVITEGFRGVVTSEFGDKTLKLNRSFYSPSESEQAVTLRRLGLSKSGVQERIDLLAEVLHVQQVSDDKLAILEERRKRMMTDLEMSASCGPGTDRLDGSESSLHKRRRIST